ncbi:TPR-like protein [Cryphonectria parasitica EP155]|uniref:TPR-like protein n=1 Tax=Cryphonectria parasitica (strain ATCC 38755 / EP155) TaxID=660469 RepID=A0A9P4Y0H8_CRYP1|nr:TPR-like protein [Cryphonectria parasitica EP155]KAF3764273.1 TPR-like protein [Cryphonectria parasitica EP155]
MSTADELKALGNKAIAAKNFDEAVPVGSRLIDLTLLLNNPMGDPMGGLGQMFNDPNLITKLASNPKTSSLVSDASFMQKIQQIQRDPKSLDFQEMMGDQRFLQVLGVLMGVDMQMGMPGEADPAGAAGPQEPEQKSAPEPAPKKAPEPEPEPEPMDEDEESINKRKAKEEADKEKALGTAEYKKRNFDAAIEHYTKAWETHKDITYLTNLGAAYFEKGDYDECIKACTKAVDEGREIYADFKLIAKAYSRIGTAYEKQGDLEKAIEYYNMSLREHRTPETLNKLRAAEKRKLEEAKTALIDPEKAEEARLKGNDYFKKADWTEAYKAYEDMAKRAPEDPRSYSNKAAALIKLGELPSALDECNTAIKKDKTFIRAYIRKAQCLFMMKRYSDCLDACDEAAQVDNEHHGGANAKEIEQQSQKALGKMYEKRENETEAQTRERIMQDPDIMSIMQDPVMQSILQQAQSDPGALREHMKNASVRSKIQKLIAAGVIRVG